jgi:hypothetical protein
MRFRPKFGLMGWLWVTLACMAVFFAAFGSGRPAGSLHGFSAAIFALLPLQQILLNRTHYWELDAASLRVNLLWNTKEIGWDEIKRVGGSGGRAAANTLEVEYARAAPLSERGRVLANPQDRQQFIDALKRFAPQATFEV